MKDRKILQHSFEHKISLDDAVYVFVNFLVPCFGPLAIQNVTFVVVCNSSAIDKKVLSAIKEMLLFRNIFKRKLEQLKLFCLFVC